MKNKKMKFFVITLVFLCLIIVANTTSFAGTISSDINGINESKYPGVKSLIQNLQNKHSNYKFQVYYTGIDWTEAVTMEYQGHGSSPKNLFSASAKYQGKWYCPICGSKAYDTGWHCASKEAIEYMMDPRNSLDETSVFQFKNLENSDVTAENIQTVINNKYSSYSYINNSVAINAIINASSTYGLNGYSILAKIVNEQGRGTSPLATGSGYEGEYVGYYNFFNVGAYGNGISTVMRNGLKYAKNKGWNTVEKSILGGSEYYKSQYIGRGQNTLYYQRFNVTYANSLFSHQYQQDIMGAQTSGTLLKKYYETSGTISSIEQNFIIPLYENMPVTACARPSTTENNQENYEIVKVLNNKQPVKATPNGTRIISYLNKDENVKVIKRATSISSDGNYWDTIVTETDGTYGYVLRSGISHVSKLSNYLFDAEYYADNNLDVKAVYGYDDYKLLEHFYNYGIKEGRKSSPTFDVKYYLEANNDVRAAYGNDYVKAYNHFKNYGCNEYRKSSKEYDGTFYKYYYSDVTNLSSIELMEHYLKIGRPAGRLGGLDYYMDIALFDTTVYTKCNPDIQNAFGNDSVALKRHWLQYGIAEGRISSLVYVSNIYAELNEDLKNAYGKDNRKLFEHFVKYGVKENRLASLVFNLPRYLELNSDVKNAYKSNTNAVYYHFEFYGAKEGRSSGYTFEVKNYINYNQDIKAAYGTDYKSACIHFLHYGIHEPRRTSLRFNLVYYMNTYKELQREYKTNYYKYYVHYLKYGSAEGRKGA